MMQIKRCMKLFALLAVFCLAFAAGCGGEETGNQNDGLDAGGPDAADAACSPGQIGCECTAQGQCNTGSCQEGVCVDCRPGEEACACRSNGSCNAGLTCEADLCVTCPEGEQGCACAPDGSCADGLQCQSGMCVEETCSEGSLSCPCRADGEACDAELICGDNGLCQECATDVPGCPCEAGSCAGGLVCGDDDSCREPTTCDDVVCGDFQLCEEQAGADAACVEKCETGYEWDSDAGACVECPPEGCAQTVACDPNDANSLYDDCAAENRKCTIVDGQEACGECVDGAVSSGGACLLTGECNGQTCATGEYCDWDAGSCQTRPCPAGQAQSPTGTCQDCSITCSGEGKTGRVWAFQTTGEKCICEVEVGYFLDVSTGDAVLCDADGDGWVREEAADATRVDPQVQQNTRCEIREVDSFKLVDQYGLDLEVAACADADGLNLGLVGNPDATNCPDPYEVRLLESARNDVGGTLLGQGADVNEAPKYDTNSDPNSLDGRALQAREVNALTKGCVDDLADYNDNGVADLTEVQNKSSDVAAFTEGPALNEAILNSFAFFMELHSTYYEPPASGNTYGTLVIQERSRCANDFPFHYDSSVDPRAGTPADAYDQGSEGPWWRNCYVSRDANYNDTAATYDFRQWSCDPSSDFVEGCALTEPIQPAIPPGYPISEVDQQKHGLCHLGGQLPEGWTWRGMNHHSQFKCVQTTNAPFDSDTPYLRPYDAFDPQNGTLTLNVCETVCDRNDASCTDSQPTAPGALSYEPQFACEAMGVALDSGNSPGVGFAAVRYQPYGKGIGGSYEAGCVNEDELWGSLLCPSVEEAGPFCRPNGDQPPLVDYYGRYSCYGSPKYGNWDDTSGNPPAEGDLMWAAPGATATNQTVWSVAGCN